MIVGSIVQILIAVAIVVILFVVGFAIYNMELVKAVTEIAKQKKETPIFQGVIDFQATNNLTYNTADPKNMLYRDLSGSVNQMSGAEYTYNFWLFNNLGSRTADGNASITADSSYVNSENHVLLLRGDKSKVHYKNLCNTYKQDVLVKSPMIRLMKNGDVLVVDLNTLSGPDAVKEKSRNVCAETSNEWEFMNSYRIGVENLNEKYNNKWIMVTVVVQDTYPTDPLPVRNKVRVRIFVNGVLELDRYLDGKLNALSQTTVLKQNRAPLYVYPTTLSATVSTTNKLKMADLSYFNYALTAAEITDRFNAGFKQDYANPLEVRTSMLTPSSTKDENVIAEAAMEAQLKELSITV